jgi:hypothetical protein
MTLRPSCSSGQTHFDCRITVEDRAVTLEETAMSATEAVYEPELVELMQSALDVAGTLLPKTERTSATKVKLASHILAAAAKGERDPMELIIAALLKFVDGQEDDINRGYSQLQRLRKRVEQADRRHSVAIAVSDRTTYHRRTARRLKSLTKCGAISTLASDH